MATRSRKSAKRVAAPRLRSEPRSRSIARPPSAHDELVATKADLEATSTTLMAIDPQSLSDAEHKLWSEEVNQIDLAIARVRNSLLNGIAEAFEAELPAIQASTSRLKADLAKAKEAVQVINIIAGALGVIEQVIRLGR